MRTWRPDVFPDGVASSTTCVCEHSHTQLAPLRAQRFSLHTVTGGRLAAHPMAKVRATASKPRYNKILIT